MRSLSCSEVIRTCLRSVPMSLASTLTLRSPGSEEQPAITALGPDTAGQVDPALPAPLDHELVQAGDVPLGERAGRAAGGQGRRPQDAMPDGRGQRGERLDGPAGLRACRDRQTGPGI